jgi:hypothetical protein
LSALLLHFPRFINQQLEARGFKDFQFQHCHTHTHTHNLQLRPSEKETCEVTKAENPSHMSKWYSFCRNLLNERLQERAGLEQNLPIIEFWVWSTDWRNCSRDSAVMKAV